MCYVGQRNSWEFTSLRAARCGSTHLRYLRCAFWRTQRTTERLTAPWPTPTPQFTFTIAAVVMHCICVMHCGIWAKDRGTPRVRSLPGSPLFPHPAASCSQCALFWGPVCAAHGVTYCRCVMWNGGMQSSARAFLFFFFCLHTCTWNAWSSGRSLMPAATPWCCFAGKDLYGNWFENMINACLDFCHSLPLRCVYTCVCVCVWERERERERGGRVTECVWWWWW